MPTLVPGWRTSSPRPGQLGETSARLARSGPIREPAGVDHREGWRRPTRRTPWRAPEAGRKPSAWRGRGPGDEDVCVLDVHSAPRCSPRGTWWPCSTRASTRRRRPSQSRFPPPDVVSKALRRPMITPTSTLVRGDSEIEESCRIGRSATSLQSSPLTLVTSIVRQEFSERRGRRRSRSRAGRRRTRRSGPSSA